MDKHRKPGTLQQVELRDAPAAPCYHPVEVAKRPQHPGVPDTDEQHHSPPRGDEGVALENDGVHSQRGFHMAARNHVPQQALGRRMGGIYTYTTPQA